MAHKFLDLAFTPPVQAAQLHYYGRSQVLPPALVDDVLGPEETAFIAARDSFYLSSVSASGWPYVQHRGGPVGFCQVTGPNEISFADFKGNRQMLTTGNVATEDRVCLFMMDYANRERLKLLGHVEVIDARDRPALVHSITTPELAKITERIFRIRIVAFDWNCPKYITPRYSAEEVGAVIAPLKARIAQLEAQLGN